MSAKKQGHGISVFKVFFEWLLPIVGGILSGFFAIQCGGSFWWVLLFAVLGAFALQWTVAFLLLGINRAFRTKSDK